MVQPELLNCRFLQAAGPLLFIFVPRALSVGPLPGGHLIHVGWMTI